MTEETKKKVHETMNGLKIEVCEKSKAALEWAKANKKAVSIIAPVVISSGVELIKVLSKRGTANDMKRLKDLYVYDHRTGHYYELRRKLKSHEWIEFDERKARGETVAAILNDMRLLK